MPPATGDVAFLQREGNHSFARLILGQPDLVLALRARFDATLTKLGALGPVIEQRQFWPFVAYGQALKGDFKGAHATADRTPLDCNQCLRIRGMIDMLQKNWGGAGYWFARATHDAPSVPLPLSDWGHMLLEKGDFDGAIEKFETAYGLSPRFADPIEMWGEALAKKGRADLALKKFEEANRYTPHWGRLHLKWGEALLWSGDKTGAAKQFAIAQTLSLTASEKAELEKMKPLAG